MSTKLTFVNLFVKASVLLFAQNRVNWGSLMKYLKISMALREGVLTKNTFQFGHCPKVGGGGFSLDRIFLRRFFY